jgi:hypothetical protein
MAFDEKDISEQKQIAEIRSVEEITFRRNRELAGVNLEIIVIKIIDVDGEKRRVSGRVPVSKVNAAWPGAAKTLKQHLLTIIDNTEFTGI